MIDAEHLARLPARDENGLLHAFIECPKGNTHKIDLDKYLGIFAGLSNYPKGSPFRPISASFRRRSPQTGMRWT